MKMFLAIKGIKELSNALKKHHEQVIKKRKNVMHVACLRIERDTKKDCPVLTGNLKGSYNHEVRVKGNVIEGINGTIVPYAPFAENHKPHLRPAYEKNLEKNVSDFKKILTETGF